MADASAGAFFQIKTQNSEGKNIEKLRARTHARNILQIHLLDVMMKNGRLIDHHHLLIGKNDAVVPPVDIRRKERIHEGTVVFASTV